VSGDADDVRALEQLKYAYLRTLDLKQWDEFAGLFVPEATGSYGTDLSFGSRAELVGYMRKNLPADLITMHQAHHPEITVDDDTATGRWYLHDKVFAPAFGFALEGAAFYDDRMVRTPDGWRFTHVGYRRTFESSWSTKEVPGWSMQRGTAYDV
jgi:hypothetical protein